MKNKLSTLFLFLTIYCAAQTVTGPNPRKIDWKCINTPAGRIIFEQQLTPQAQKIAGSINFQSDSLHTSVGSAKKKLGLLLVNSSVQSNGFVALSPFRSEFFTTAPQSAFSLGSLNWLDLLAMHEYRHVQQFSNTLNGLTKTAYWLFGQNGWAALTALAIPNWYFEGDAVYAESAFSKAGRGRMPHFTIEQRALGLQGEAYSYAKARNGSFKDLVPDHYSMGYTLTNYMRLKKGTNVLVPILQKSSAYKRVLYSFGRQVYNQLDVGVPRLYKDAMEHSHNHWKQQRDTLILSPAKILTIGKKRTITNYLFPQFTNDTSIIALKKSYRTTDEIVLINLKNHNEQKVRSIGFNAESYFNYQNNQMVWEEVSQNPRRSHENYSDVYWYNLQSKQSVRLTHKDRAFSPILNTQCTEVYFLTQAKDLGMSLEKIDLVTKQRSVIYKFDKTVFMARPTFCQGGQSVALIQHRNGRPNIVKLNLQNLTLTELTPQSNHPINNLNGSDNYVYFSTSYTGIDNAFKVGLEEYSALEQLTNLAIGLQEVAVSKDGKMLVFNEQNARGIHLKTIEVLPINLDFTLVEPFEMEWQDKGLLKKEYNASLATKVGDYVVKDYKGFVRGLQLHSWVIDPSKTSTGANLLFQNNLSDLVLSTGLYYNRVERAELYQLSAEILRWFPSIKLEAVNANRKSPYLDTDGKISNLTFQERSLRLAVGVPLSWLKNNYSIAFKPTFFVGHSAANNLVINKKELPNNRFVNAGFEYDFSFLRRKARQNFDNSWGIRSQLEVRGNISNTDNQKISLKNQLLLPGLTKNHSLRIGASYQKELLQNTFQYLDQFNYARGYTNYNNDAYQMLSLEYGLPLFYPDFGVLGINYFKRIRANLFADFGSFQDKRTSTSYKPQESVGFELLFDSMVLNTFEMTFGFRTSYLLTSTGFRTPVYQPFLFTNF
jgi:hypothetical protein